MFPSKDQSPAVEAEVMGQVSKGQGPRPRPPSAPHSARRAPGSSVDRAPADQRVPAEVTDSGRAAAPGVPGPALEKLLVAPGPSNWFSPVWPESPGRVGTGDPQGAAAG